MPPLNRKSKGVHRRSCCGASGRLLQRPVEGARNPLVRACGSCRFRRSYDLLTPWRRPYEPA